MASMRRLRVDGSLSPEPTCKIRIIDSDRKTLYGSPRENNDRQFDDRSSNKFRYRNSPASFRYRNQSSPEAERRKWSGKSGPELATVADVLADLKNDVKVFKSDIQNLKTDINSNFKDFNSDVRDLKSDISELKFNKYPDALSNGRGNSDNFKSPPRTSSVLSKLGSPRSPTGSCFTCKQPGHFARNCPLSTPNKANRSDSDQNWRTSPRVTSRSVKFASYHDKSS